MGGLPLGVFDDTEYPRRRSLFGPAIIMCFYTDGITEAMDAQNKQFGLERLNEVLARCDLSAAAMSDAILDSLGRFTSGNAAHDDRTLLVAKVLWEGADSASGVASGRLSQGLPILSE